MDNLEALIKSLTATIVSPPPSVEKKPVRSKVQKVVEVVTVAAGPDPDSRDAMKLLAGLVKAHGKVSRDKFSAMIDNAAKFLRLAAPNLIFEE